MCGISGIIVNKKYFLGSEVYPSDLFDLIEKTKNNDQNINNLLDSVWDYKSNINFIRYCKDPDERKAINEASEQILKLSITFKNYIEKIDRESNPHIFIKKYEDYEKILDCHWFLSKEIPSWKSGVNELLNNNILKADDSTIIIYKSILLVIKSIDNRLEIRGRDSFGLSIQFNEVDKLKISTKNKITNKGKTKYFIEDEHKVATFVFKTANKIGSLGDNALDIKNQLTQSKLLKKIIFKGNYETVSIVAHTRWASVGEINLPNCHPCDNTGLNGLNKFPLVFSSMNGDIYNYREIIKDKEKKLKYHFNKEFTSDCQAIAVSMTNIKYKSPEMNKVFCDYHGSFAIALQTSINPGEIQLIKKGNQGLYIGLSNDQIMFASDVYGLIESCRFFYPIESNQELLISKNNCLSNKDFSLTINSINTNNKIVLNKNHLKTTNITTRDIDKKGNKHFLKKEIYETEDILNRTILRYLQSDNLINNKNLFNSIIVNNKEVPLFICEKLKNNEIDKIIITGMGTCYTAAVAISRYMREILNIFSPGIIVEPHIASEGSAFYLTPNMNDTLVIVIAQSGTTIDTNVFAKMSKDRGASTLAIANKREGDITRIVDGTLYIGNGRDIEIAVPSTKTYTAQVILGYILTLYFSIKLNDDGKHNNLIFKNIKLLKETPKLVNQTFNILNSQNLEKLFSNNPILQNEWYIGFDNSPNAVCAMEIRIKYSECCYQSLPYININELAKLKIKNSFIIFITTKESYEFESILIELLKKKNRLIVISPNKIINKIYNKFILNGYLTPINIPQAAEYYFFIPTIIAGQLIAYFTAISLDARKINFKNLLDAILDKKTLKKEWELFISSLKAGVFNQGFSIDQFQTLNKSYKNYTLDNTDENLNNFKNDINLLYNYSKKPIDTIKHQAKTITVGSLRQKDLLRNNLFDDELTINSIKANPVTLLIETLNEFVKLNQFDNVRKIYIHGAGVSEKIIYFIINYLNSLAKKIEMDAEFIFVRDYNLDNYKIKRINEKWIIIFGSNYDKRLYKLILKKNNSIISFYLVGEKRIKALKNLQNKIYKNNNSSTMFISNILIAINIFFIFLKNNKELVSDVNKIINNSLVRLEKSWHYMINSDALKDEVHYVAKYLLSKRNWKCVGSGVNYLTAKYAAIKIFQSFNKSCAFDVLENHKHIDMSSESALLVFIANIWRDRYQNDALAEITKMISHDNIPIVITNIGDKRFDKMNMKINSIGEIKDLKVPVIKIPKVDEELSFILNFILVDKLIAIIPKLNNSKKVNCLSFINPSETTYN